MKARTEFQRLALKINSTLKTTLSASRLTDIQRKHGVIFTSKKEGWCSCCGSIIPAGNIKTKCPHCGAVCEVKDNPRKRVECVRYYYTVLEVRGENQVIRGYLVDRKTYKGQAPTISINEAFRAFISPKGERAVIARPVNTISGYYDAWRFNEPMTLKEPTHIRYSSYGNIGCRARLMPALVRKHIKSLWPEDNPQKQIIALLTSPTYETIFKEGEVVLSDYWLYYSRREQIIEHWPSIKIARKHGFKFDTKDAAGMWFDMVGMMAENGYDLHNPVNVAPADLKAKHDEVLRRDQRRIAEQRKKDEADKAAALKDINHELNVKYRNALGAILDVVIKVNDLTIRPLQSLIDFYEEGEAMHHCVYSNRYYNHPHTVIFSVRRGNKRISTLEFNTAARDVIQNRGKYNSVPEMDREVCEAVIAKMKQLI